ncbi:MAG: dTDP-4-dehydrorhamnose reductase [Oscillatoriaceae bacterium SKW80]|nr:dTDP-4-dehydrorhamnose reductase [Oscillatoriaceae bacterium SKYG93]MCX8122004.1 dTDP-4-dehydrorhamnose reductase [Oscillatoriaceae bacterium SKW80]MDW8454290.1 dTDP-4-dehydrorhamnose reductase [Oscillatoriaceae cyanobacterium SKYGB_i_bin93]HIK29154.1 dTDP-4-dehydrorhamnose reductase [Oscillatoriaceae cyanobacterium M7585_C2015_266]
MRRILITGSNGQLGWELQRTLAPVENVIAVSRARLDLSQPASITQVVQEVKPNIIINAAAYTAVDKAESEPSVAYAVNATGVGVLAEIAQQLAIPLIHISTDYVFDGKNNLPYLETDATNPLGVYGKSKLAGEEAIRKVGGNFIIIRTAWLYGVGGKSNFVKTMLRLGSEREEVRVVTDQVGSPTWTGDLAAALAQLIANISPKLEGTYHYTNSGVASWYDFAVAVFEEAQLLGFPLKVKRVVPITTAQYPTPARRPAYSVLSCAKITAALGTYPPHWRQALRKMLQELSAITNHPKVTTSHT